MFRIGKSPLTFAESVSDLDSEGSRSEYPLPAFLSLSGSVANGDGRLRIRPGTHSVVFFQFCQWSAGKFLVLLCPLLLFVKWRDIQFHLVTHIEHIAWHVLIIVYHYFCHDPYSISLLLFGFIADLCQTCIFTYCVILYAWLASNSHLRRRLCGPGVWRQGWERGVIYFLILPGVWVLSSSPYWVGRTGPPPFPASKRDKGWQLDILPSQSEFWILYDWREGS